MKNRILTGLQWVLVVIWAVAGLALDKEGLNLFKLNIAPTPNVAVAGLTFVLVMIGYWLQSLKDKEKE